VPDLSTVGTEVPGMTLGVTALAPPVVTPGTAPGSIRVTWGDAKLNGIFNPQVFGRIPEEGPSVPLASHASITLDFPLEYDQDDHELQLGTAAMSIALELGDVVAASLNRTAVEAAILAALQAATPELVENVVVATPVPQADLTDFVGSPVGTKL